MLMGIKLKAHPTAAQKLRLSQWMGCARFIWNAKCEENSYHNRFARAFCPIGTYGPIDQQYAQFKDSELSPWLSECPSQILRNSASNWYQTYISFMKGACGKPRRKKKDGRGSIHLTRELFRFEQCSDGVARLFIGTKKNNIGFLSMKFHKPFNLPNSIHIRKHHGKYWVSFCYEDESNTDIFTQNEHLQFLRGCSQEFLERHVIGIDRGVVRPIQAGCEFYDLNDAEKIKKRSRQRYVRRYQRRLSKQMKGSKRRLVTKIKLGKAHEKLAAIRQNFCHKASKSLVDREDCKIFVLEDLKIQAMSRRAKPKLDENGVWKRTQAKAKSGLNRSILDQGWHQFEAFLSYKAFRAGKVVFKVSPHYTSQECSACGNTHSGNRRSQATFSCMCCGYTENADRNAAEVIKKRAIGLILNSGSELSARNILVLTDKGRGASSKSLRANVRRARGDETSKKKRTASA